MDCLPGGAEPRPAEDRHLHHGDGGRPLLSHRAAIRGGVGRGRSEDGKTRLRHDTLVPLHLRLGD